LVKPSITEEEGPQVETTVENHRKTHGRKPLENGDLVKKKETIIMGFKIDL
jgi:hypothetical protein